jgi:hypothetical protein
MDGGGPGVADRAQPSGGPIALSASLPRRTERMVAHAHRLGRLRAALTRSPAGLRVVGPGTGSGPARETR